MTPCEHCGEPLRQFRLFRQRCPVCGTLHRASHKGVAGGWRFLGGALGFATPFLLVGGFFLPGPLWVPLLIVPGVLLATGITLSLAMQRWHRVPEPSGH